MNEKTRMEVANEAHEEFVKTGKPKFILSHLLGEKTMDRKIFGYLETKPCPWCSQIGEVGITTEEVDGIKRYEDGALIQEAFPTMPPEDREQLISGVHPLCWKAMFEEGDTEIFVPPVLHNLLNPKQTTRKGE